MTVDNMKGLWLAALEDVHVIIHDVPDERITTEAQKLAEQHSTEAAKFISDRLVRGEK